MNQLGKFNGVLLVSDFDDTLYGEDMRITRENVEALTYFTREGGTFTVATGRARPNFAPHASHIPINAPVILSNGSALYDFRTGEMIYETFLPDRVREDLQQMARAIPTIGFEAYHHDAIYVYQPNAVTQRHLERAGITAREVPIADIPLPWSKVILQQDYETLLHTQRYLLERWGEHYEVIFSNRVLLELTRKGSSKGGMVQYLARRLGIDAQHTPGWLNYQRKGTFANIYANAPEGKAYAWTIAQVKSILEDETYIENSVHYRETNISNKNKKRIRKDPSE